MNLNALSSLIARYLGKFRYGSRAHPLRDWLIVMLVAVVLLLLSAGWSYYLFNRISSQDILGTKQAAVVPADTASLDTVLRVFSSRATERTHYLSDYHFVDPSK